MTEKTKIAKIGVIAVVTMAVAYLHYQARHGDLALHLVHRELFFIPIILAAFWFGLKGGLFSSSLICLIYAPHIVTFYDPHGNIYTVVVQLAIFLLVGTLLGFLVSKREKAYAEKVYLDEIFGKYVPQKIRQHILEGGKILDGSISKITVLAVKIQNIHTEMERLPPWQIVQLINTYFSEMAEIVLKYDGLMIGFTEDEFKILYGAPVSQHQHYNLGVKTALEMRERLIKINNVLTEKKLPNLIQTIGVHSGLGLGAAIGPPSRKTYNVIGPTVRVAQLIRRHCEVEDNDILISDDTLSGTEKVFDTGKISYDFTHNGNPVRLSTISSEGAFLG